MNLSKPEGQIFIITGQREAGKTTLCRSVIELARERNWTVAGLLSPGIFQKGQKTGIQVIDLHTDQSRALAQKNTGEIYGTRTKTWNFDENALQWGNECLKMAVPCQLLVVDELGILEFDQGQGWMSGFSAIDSHQYSLAMIVIRPELLQSAFQHWPDAITISIESVEDIPGVLQELSILFFQAGNPIDKNTTP
jgi:nucleoside-triphosphatase